MTEAMSKLLGQSIIIENVANTLQLAGDVLLQLAGGSGRHVLARCWEAKAVERTIQFISVSSAV